MLTVLPAIWVAELKILNEKIEGGVDECQINAANQYYSVGSGLVCIPECEQSLSSPEF